MSASDDPQQCRALTKEGNRCSRDAVDGQFCHQHDENDPTIDDEDAPDQNMNDQVEDEVDQDASSLSATESGESEEGTEANESDASEPDESDETEADETEAEADEATEAEESEESESSAGGVMEIRDAVRSVATELVGYPLDGIIEITRREDGWTAVIEVIERRSVPDTQDILGRYEITLEDTDTVAGYRRTGRHRRSDTGDDIRE